MSYDKKIVISGNDVEVYDYSKEIRTNFIVVPRKRKSKKELKQKSLFEKISIEELKKQEDNLKKSLYRTKQNLKRLINSNIALRKFVTLTFAENLQDIEKANKYFELFIKRLKYKYPNLQYIAIPELQKRGAVHYHLLLNLPYVKNSKLREIWGLGFVNIRSTQHSRNIGSYLSKYLTKDNFNVKVFKGKKKYFYSRNLKRCIVILGYTAIQVYKTMIKGKELVYKKKFKYNKYVGICRYKNYMLTAFT